MKKILLVVLMLISGMAQASNYEADAKNWLAILDSQDYSKSWEQAHKFFKSQIAKAEWEKKAKLAREPMGKLVARKLVKSGSYKELPGAPDGEYVVLSYASSFTNKKNAMETLTLSKSGKSWLMVGYYIK